MAVEPQHIWWRDYLLEKGIEPQSTAHEGRPPSHEKGNQLIAKFFNRYFDNLVEKWNRETEHLVVSIPADTVKPANGVAPVKFNGSRLENHLETRILLVSVDERADLSHLALRHLADSGDLLRAPLLVNHYYFTDAASRRRPSM